MRLATTESYLDKNKVRQERTDWHNVVLWGKRGEALAKFLAKGRRSSSKEACARRATTIRTATSATRPRCTPPTSFSPAGVVVAAGGGGGPGGWATSPPAAAGAWRRRRRRWLAPQTTSARRRAMSRSELRADDFRRRRSDAPVSRKSRAGGASPKSCRSATTISLRMSTRAARIRVAPGGWDRLARAARFRRLVAACVRRQS